jgi:hypothetical protein
MSFEESIAVHFVHISDDGKILVKPYNVNYGPEETFKDFEAKIKQFYSTNNVRFWRPAAGYSDHEKL